MTCMIGCQRRSDTPTCTFTISLHLLDIYYNIYCSSLLQYYDKNGTIYGDIDKYTIIIKWEFNTCDIKYTVLYCVINIFLFIYGRLYIYTSEMLQFII